MPIIRRSRKEQKEDVINFIKSNPKTTVSEVQDKVRANVRRLFGGIEEAFSAADIEYPRKRLESKKIIIEILRKNPLLTIEEIQSKFKVSFYKHFKSSEEAYKTAKIGFISKKLKRKMNKQKIIIDYIKNRQNATQWEINKDCKTHVQEIFQDGIKEAFRKANVKYPSGRLNVYGIARKSVKNRATNFENKILDVLKSKGACTQVRVPHGIIDALIKINGKPYVVEIKDYKTKPISLSDIKQINKYLDDLKCKNGIIICSGHRQIERVKFNSKEIIIMPETYISGINGVMVQPG